MNKQHMRSFDRDDRRVGGHSGGGFGDRKPRGRGFDDRGQGRPTMHSATCSDCGSACEVPFRPTGNKPVLCSNCFKGSANQGFSRNAGGRSFSKPRFDDKRMFEAVCDKCHKSCEVPFRPTGDKPVYCSECFTKGDSGEKSNEQLNKQIDAINSKLDRILKALARTAPDALLEPQEEKKPVSKSKKGGVIVVANKKKIVEIVEDEPVVVEKKVKKVKAEKKVAKKTKKEKKVIYKKTRGNAGFY